MLKNIEYSIGYYSLKLYSFPSLVQNLELFKKKTTRFSITHSFTALPYQTTTQTNKQKVRIQLIILKILESWATPNWSKRSVGQEESRSQVPDPQSPIPDPEFQILNSNSQVQIPKHVKFSWDCNVGSFGWNKKFWSKIIWVGKKNWVGNFFGSGKKI